MVRKIENFFIVNAPAGSGKTTTIREMINNIISINSKDNVLCITYTNRAADELSKSFSSPNISIKVFKLLLLVVIGAVPVTTGEITGFPFSSLVTTVFTSVFYRKIKIFSVISIFIILDKEKYIIILFKNIIFKFIINRFFFKINFYKII